VVVGNDWLMTKLANLRIPARESNGRRLAVANLAIPWTIVHASRANWSVSPAGGWEIYGEYVDSGISGSKESRPELNRLMLDAHRRHFDLMLCWKVDRFGRSLKHLVNALADLDSYGVAFVSLRDNLDLSTPSGGLMFQIIGANGGI
jgi:Resolvase, N terminal domain